MSYCKNFQMLAINDTGEKKLLARTRCKMWTCEYCAEINRQQWRARLIDYINKSNWQQWSWWTLTAHSKKRTPSDSLKNLRDAWQKLIQRMRRRYGKFEYTRVYEKHESGAYHLHTISSFHFGDIATRTQKNGDEVTYSRWLAKTAKKLRLGYYTHADDIECGHHGGYVASYITKYVVKLSVSTKSELGRVRHIQTSQGWPKLPQNNNGDWKIATGYYESEFSDDMANRRVVVDISTGKVVDSDDFINSYVYPIEFSHYTTFADEI